MTQRGKKIAAIAGGVFGVALLVCGWFAYSAVSGASKAEKQLKRVKNEFEQKKNEVKPPSAAEAALKDMDAIEARCAEMREKIAEMSFKYEPMSIGAFQSRLQTRLAELSALEHGNPGPLVKTEANSDFDFGFEKRSFGDDDTGRLPALQRQLEDTGYMVNVLARSNIQQIEEIKYLKPEGEKSASGGAKPADSSAGLSKTTYTVKFTASPAALVMAVNIFSGGANRFTVIDSMDFKPAKDAIQERVAPRADNVRKAAAGMGRGRSRRGRAAQPVKPAGDAEVVREVAFEPKEDGILSVEMKISFYDCNAAARKSAPDAEGGDKPATEAVQ